MTPETIRRRLSGEERAIFFFAGSPTSGWGAAVTEVDGKVRANRPIYWLHLRLYDSVLPRVGNGTTVLDHEERSLNAGY